MHLITARKLLCKYTHKQFSNTFLLHLIGVEITSKRVERERGHHGLGSRPLKRLVSFWPRVSFEFHLESES